MGSAAWQAMSESGFGLAGITKGTNCPAIDRPQTNTLKHRDITIDRIISTPFQMITLSFLRIDLTVYLRTGDKSSKFQRARSEMAMAMRNIQTAGLPGECTVVEELTAKG